jgi:hypothetical protein
MARIRQHLLGFDLLEGKVLLSKGMADPAAIVHQQRALRFHLNGTIKGLPAGISVPDGYIVSSFFVNGHVASMGNVSGAFYIADTYIPIGKLPDLSKASLVLANQKGSVRIALNTSGSHHYKFTIMSGTGIYTYASGKGHLTISATRHSPDFIIKMKD